MTAIDPKDHVPNYLRPRPDLITGGQPEPGAWAALRAAGVQTVVNLRALGELEGRDVASEVARAGLQYVSLPVDGAGGITDGNADALWSVLESRQGTALVHCASGNRAGALLAVGAARSGATLDRALAFGRAAGLTGLEPRVRELLDAQAS